MRHRLTCALAAVATVVGIMSVANSAASASVPKVTAAKHSNAASTRPWHGQARNVRALAASPDRIRLSWSNPNLSGFAGMIIRRNGLVVAQTPSHATSYLDRGLVPGRSYEYSVVAVNSAHRSGAAVHASTRTPESVVARKPRAVQAQLEPSAPRDAVLGTIDGTVTASGGSPLESVDVVVYDSDDNYVADGFTDSTGAYEIDGLVGDVAPGYTVCFFAFYTTGGTSSTGYASQCNADVPWTGDYGTPAAGSTPVPLDGGDTQEVDATLDAGGAVSGQVVEAAGSKQPIDDVNVLVFDSDGSSPFSVPTGTNGRYRINGLQPGQYWVCFDATNADGGTSTTGYVSKCYQTAPFDGFDVPAGAKPITVTASADHQSVNGNLPAAGAVEGTVTDTDSNALTDYNVDAFDSDGNFVFVAATTDPNTGSYKLTGLPPSKTGYTICFDATEITAPATSGYVSQCYQDVTWDGNDLPGGTTPVTLTSGQTAHGIDAHLATGGAITGTTTSATSTKPVRDVEVQLYLDGNFVTGKETSSTGKYTFRGLVPGQYTACFDASLASGGGAPAGYRDQCYVGVPWDGGDLPSGTTAVSADAGTTQQNVNAQLVSAGGISGTVTSGGAGVDNVNVIVFDADGNDVGNAITSTNGGYHVYGLAAGAYTVCFDASQSQGGPSAEGYRSQCFNNKAWAGPDYDVPTGATVVNVSAAKVHTGVNAKLAAGGEIAGTVTTSAGGLPLGDVSVDVFTANGASVANGFTDANGDYQLRGLAASPSAGYRVCFDASEAVGGTSAGGYLDQCYNGVAWDGFDVPDGAAAVTVAVGSSTEVDAALDDGGAIAGTVTSEAHAKAIDDVRVEVYDDTTGDFVNGIYSGTDGVYQVNGLPAGSYAVCFDPFDASGGGVSTGYLPQCYNDVAWDEFDVPSDAQPVSVSVDAVAGPINAVLASAGAISGTVTAQSDSAPLGDVDVAVIAGDGSYVTDQYTLDNGKYDITGLTPSSSGYHVCFDASQATGGTAVAGYRSQCWNNRAWSPGAAVPSAATAVKVTAGATHSGITAKLLSGSGVAGTVTSASDGTPVADTQVEVLDTSGNFVDSGSTGTDGSYQVIGLTAPAAGFVVCFVGPGESGPATGYGDQCYQNTAWNGEADVPSGVTKVHTQVNTIKGGIDAALVAGAAVTGTITSAATHNALPNVFVGVYASEGIAAGAETGADGTYTITGLTAGVEPYYLCVSAGPALHGTTTGLAPQCWDDSSSGVPWDGATQAIPAGAAALPLFSGFTSDDVDAALAPAGAMAGVIKAGGSPVTDGLVQVFDTAGYEVGESGTGANGNYKVYGLLPASYTVCFSALDGAWQPQCYNGVPWDGNVGDLPSGTTPVTVHAGTVKNNVNATLQATPA